MKENRNKKRYKVSKLGEWIILFSKKEWNGVYDMAGGNLFRLGPLPLNSLEHIRKYLQKLKTLILSDKRGTDFDLDNFNRITGMKLNEQEWLTVKSEISKACVAYKKFQLAQTKNPFVELELQYFFLDHNMNKNLDAIQNANHKLIHKSKVNDNYQGVWITRNRELEMIDVRNKNVRKNLLDLNNLQASIELFYHENKLRVLSEKVARNIFSKEYDLSSEELDWVSRIPKEIKDAAQIRVYTQVFNMLTKNCDDTFGELKKLLLERDIKNQLSPKYLSHIYGYLIVHCTRRMNDEKIVFIEEYLKFISILEKDNLLLEQGNIPIWRMKNVIKVCSKINKFDWAEAFIIRQRNMLDKKEKNAILDYCLALLAYKKGDYTKAYDILHNKKPSKDILIKVDSLILYLFILLELEDDQFDRYRDNARGIIRYSKEEKVKGKVSDDVIRKWRKSINYLSRTYENIDAEEWGKIKMEINADIFFPGKEWLLDYLKKRMGGS